MPSVDSVKEIYSVPIDPGAFLVYAPLQSVAFVANAELVNSLAAAASAVDSPGRGELRRFLEAAGLTVDGQSEAPVTEFAGDPEPTSITLFLTTACNLRCTYCYASAGDTPTRFMTEDVARRGIAYVASNAHRKGLSSFDVTFHGGGEPTVNWRIMTRSLAFARERAGELGLAVRGFSATNGVLTDEQTDWIIANLNAVSVSFDGLPQTHDQNRLTVLGQPSSGRVMATMRRFDAAGFAYGIRVTVTADEIFRLPESVEFICNNFRPRRIQVEPAYQLGRWAAAPSAETAAFIGAFRDADERARGRGFELSYSAARAGVLTNHFCGVTQDTFALSPEGAVSACYEVFSESDRMAALFFYGKASGADGYSFELPVLNNLRRQAVQHRGHCSSCFAKWNCAGDCYHKSVTLDGGEFAGSDRCHITRELTKDQLLRKIGESGGLLWRGAFAVGQSAGKEVFDG